MGGRQDDPFAGEWVRFAVFYPAPFTFVFRSDVSNEVTAFFPVKRISSLVLL